MRRTATIFLQVVIVLIGIAVLFLLLFGPHFEGRNVNATLFQIYLNDPFLAYSYTASIAFFMALYQAFRLLAHIRQDRVFSANSVRTLRAIKYCAIALIGFLLGAEAYFWIVMRDKDDITGGVMMGLLMIFISLVVASAAAIFERTLQSAVDIKSENDLTV